VVQFLEKDLPVQNIGLTFVYCDHKRNESQRLEYFLAAIVRQLVERKYRVPRDVQNLYKNHHGKGSKPTLDEYLELLQSLSNEYSEVYAVIDALDECVDKSRKTIWNALVANLKRRVTNLRLLCTSRNIDGFEKTLPGSTCIEIKATEDDMKTYIQAQIESQAELTIFCHQNSNLQNDIIQTVTSKSEGMYVRCSLCLARSIMQVLKVPGSSQHSFISSLSHLKQISEPSEEH
jgi:hypothetical protein